MAIQDGNIYVSQNYLFLCVDLFLLDSLRVLHPREIGRSINCMNLRFALAHKVIMKDDN